MREWTDIDYAQAAIDMLPDGSVEEIAEFLRVQGIKGVRRNSSACPIANWVRHWTGVNSKVGAITVQPNPDIHPGLWFEQPLHVNAFVDAFDAGRISL